MATYVIMLMRRGNRVATAYHGIVEADSASDAERLADQQWRLDANHYHDAYHLDADDREIRSMLSYSERLECGYYD